MADACAHLAAAHKLLQQHAEINQLRERVAQAEAIIRAQNSLQIAMYNGDFEASWPREAAELEADYTKRYVVDLDGKG